MAKKSKTQSGIVETDDIIEQARKDYEQCREWWNDNHEAAKDDLQFARLGKQWPEKVVQERAKAGKPSEVYNKMPAFIRQVVNDARQNKPQIKVYPQDSGADPQTAQIINGLIRNIETTSDADVAYDTAIEHAVGQGFGFWRINTAYTCDDAFDQDIVVERVSNPFSVYGDPNSTQADSSDWNKAFIVTTMTKEEFEAEYPDAEKTDWETDFKGADGWIDGDNVVVAEYWTRTKEKGAIVALNTGNIVKLQEYRDNLEEYQLAGIEMVGAPRETETYKVTQRIMSGAEVLKTVEWAGKYIPIIAVYGDEVIDEDGKRHFRSLIRDAKGSQKTYNYMRNQAVYMLALQPRVPFIGEERAFEVDDNWDKVNHDDIPYLTVPTGAPIPQRQPPPQGSQAVLQEALNATDDMKSIIGIYDASLGARSNETSGRAIMARQREGDVSTFHFIDNLSRAIRHGGRVLLDLIPKVYSTERMIRILGEDMIPMNVQVRPGAQPQPQMNDAGKVLGGVFDLTAGKYDLTVAAGPSFTTRREETRELLTEVMQAVPDSGVFLVGRLAKLLDLPDAEELAREMDMLNPAKQQPQADPQMQAQMQQMGQMIQQSQEQAQQLAQENQQLKAQMAAKMGEHQLKARELDQQEQQTGIELYRAQTERMKVSHEISQPTQPPKWQSAANA